MTLADDVDLEELVASKDEMSGADIKAIVCEFHDSLRIL
jgi:ATP-dependent 26S proteasome regulatory subunit